MHGRAVVAVWLLDVVWSCDAWALVPAWLLAAMWSCDAWALVPAWLWDAVWSCDVRAGAWLLDTVRSCDARSCCDACMAVGCCVEWKLFKNCPRHGPHNAVRQRIQAYLGPVSLHGQRAKLHSPSRPQRSAFVPLLRSGPA
jgi:hypothetical protein